MRCKFPAHLYIRVDRDLRAALNDGAKASGENVSTFARRALRKAIRSTDQPDPPPSAPASALRAAA